MKENTAALLLALFIANFFWSCEKDDICAEGILTTPSLIIEFYDKDNRTVLKPVSDFKYYAEGMNDTLPRAGEPTTFSRIEVPLRTNATSTQWAFRLSTPVTNGVELNTDLITFNYTTNEIYVSRACGYKTNFTLNPDLEESPNPAFEDSGENDGLWIQAVSLEEPNIENEDEVHVKIYY